MNIICFDTEWRYNHHRKNEKFNLKCEHVLETIKAYHENFNFEYEKFLTRDVLLHYMQQFSGNRMKSRYQVIYISCHGEENTILLGNNPKLASLYLYLPKCISPTLALPSFMLLMKFISRLNNEIVISGFN